MTGLGCLGMMIFAGLAREPRRHEASNNKPGQTGQQSFPIAAADKVESRQRNAHAQQRAAEEPESRLFGSKTLAHRLPKSAEENRAEEKTGQSREHQQQ